MESCCWCRHLTCIVPDLTVMYIVTYINITTLKLFPQHALHTTTTQLLVTKHLAIKIFAVEHLICGIVINNTPTVS